MAGKAKKLSPTAVRMIRAWWKERREMPTRRQMCEFFGVTESALISAARRHTHKAVRP